MSSSPRCDVPPRCANETAVTSHPSCGNVRSGRWLRSSSFGVPQLRSLVAVDDQIGRIVRQLEGAGESEDTLAVFISDNGLQWGEHALFGKSTPYFPSVRVPFYLRWPGHVAPGAEDDRLVAGIDLAPTLLSAVGLEAGHDTRRPGFPRSGRRPSPPPPRVPGVPPRLRCRRGALSSRPGSSTWSMSTTAAASDFREFYGIRGDPHQLVNVLRDRDPTNDPDVAALSAVLERLRRCAGETCLR